MRTTAEATPPAPAAPRATAGRRGRAAPATAPEAREPGSAAPEPAAIAEKPPQPVVPEPPAVAVTAVRMLRVDEGLYALRVGELLGGSGNIAGMNLPAAQIAVPFHKDGNAVEIVAGFPRRGPWIDKAGGTLILRSPTGGGYVVVTAYGTGQAQTSAPALDLQRLDGPRSNPAQTSAGVVGTAGVAPPPGFTGTRDVPTEILLHIERAGDRLFPGRGWVGALGRRMRIEAMSIRPLERIAPAEIEMKGFLPNGGETPWVPGGTLCGTRGRGLPLTGFAVRVAPQHADRFDVRYQGSFFAGGISELRQNGEPCRATIADDPLEAINVRLIERGADPENPAAAD